MTTSWPVSWTQAFRAPHLLPCPWNVGAICLSFSLTWWCGIENTYSVHNWTQLRLLYEILRFGRWVWGSTVLQLPKASHGYKFLCLSNLLSPPPPSGLYPLSSSPCPLRTDRFQIIPRMPLRVQTNRSPLRLKDTQEPCLLNVMHYLW